MSRHVCVYGNNPPALNLALHPGERDVVDGKMQRILGINAQGMRHRSPDRAAMADNHNIVSVMATGEFFHRSAHALNHILHRFAALGPFRRRKRPERMGRLSQMCRHVGMSNALQCAKILLDQVGLDMQPPPKIASAVRRVRDSGVTYQVAPRGRTAASAR